MSDAAERVRAAIQRERESLLVGPPTTDYGRAYNDGINDLADRLLGTDGTQQRFGAVLADAVEPFFPVETDGEPPTDAQIAGLMVLHAEGTHGCQHTAPIRDLIGMHGPRGAEAPAAIEARDRAAVVLEAMLALQRRRGRLSKVSVDDVAGVLAIVDLHTARGGS